MYSIEEIALADTHRLFQYHLAGTYGAQFNLKGFAYPWILRSRSWSKGERILDVGAAYSLLPVHIASTFGCEVWALDDFGACSDEPFWRRGRDPQAHIQAHPEVRYVLERLGDPSKSSLPEGAFDVIYSASTLEHVPAHLQTSVWRHMDLLLRPGGEMLHTIDIGLPIGRGLPSVFKAILTDAAFPILPDGLRLKAVRATPRSYARWALKALRTPVRLPRGLGILNLILGPEVVLEPMEITYNRMVKDGMADIHHQRIASLLLRVRKAAAEG
jgi:hypothetical protein